MESIRQPEKFLFGHPDEYLTILRCSPKIIEMYRQIARYKGKRLDRWHAAEEELPVEEPIDAESEAEIVRVKRFEVRPMTPEEAIEQMELLGHHFFVFMNAEEGNINIVYRRRDSNYGLLQPQVS